MDKPLVSLVICCYNRARLLPRTLESALAQEYHPVEILVLDDGSQDGTERLMASYGDRIRYHRQENQGIAVARSNACRLARGEYIAFLDDDDLIPRQRIPMLLDALRQHPRAVLAVGDLAVIDGEDRPTGERWMPEDGTDAARLFERGDEAVLWPRVPATPHTTLFRKTDGERIGWFDERYRFAAEDKDFFARLGRLGQVVYLPRVVSLYRRGHASLTGDNLRTLSSQLQLFVNHLKELGPERSSFRRRLQWRILGTLKQMLREGASLDSDRYMREALEQLTPGGRMEYRLFSIKNSLRQIGRRGG